jgi:hypothetical protein
MSLTYYPPSRSFLPFAACAAGLLLCASHAPAQSPGTDPYNGLVAAIPSPYWGYTYTPYAVRTPLDGVASIIEAQGDFLIKKEQATLLHEKVLLAKLDRHRKELEHWEWVREFRAEALNREEQRYREKQVEFNTEYTSPAEIYSAKPLNSLYHDYLKKRELPAAGSTKVDPELLKHVHCTVSGGANIGLLKEERIYWPELLLRSDFDEDRRELEQLLAQARKQLLDGNFDRQGLPAIRRLVDMCDNRITGEIQKETRTGIADPSWNPRHYTEAMAFLTNARKLILMLGKQDAAEYLKPLKGTTVAELVAHMKARGVEFAPATAGCERYYVALHDALATEVRRLKARETSPTGP